MDLNEVAVFVKVVQMGSFSKAARFLELPTSTVSVRVSRLEKRLGITLLQRTTRRLHLTEAGQIYYENASQGLTHFYEAETAVTESVEEPCGLLRVTAPVDVGDQLLSKIILRVKKYYPKVSIELVLMNRYVDMISEGIDAAIRTGPLQDSTLIAKNVGVARWALFASPTYLKNSEPIMSPQCLRKHQCIQFPPLGKDSWSLKDGANTVLIPMCSELLSNDVGVIDALIKADAGVALLPMYLAKESYEQGTLSRVLPDWWGKADPINIVFPRQRFIPPKLRVFIDIAAEELRKVLE